VIGICWSSASHKHFGLRGANFTALLLLKAPGFLPLTPFALKPCCLSRADRHAVAIGLPAALLAGSVVDVLALGKFVGPAPVAA
jgi:hypothetical protein